MKYTEQGVPILNDSEIEERTYTFLSEYDELSLTTPMEAPIAGIFDNLKKKYKLTAYIPPAIAPLSTSLGVA